MPPAPSSVDDVVEEPRKTLPISTTPPSSAAPLPPPHELTAPTAERKQAQWHYNLREPLRQYFITRLPLYRSRNQGGSYVLLWMEPPIAQTDKGTIHERFFPTNVALYSWLVRPENKHLCGPQSLEYFIHPDSKKHT